MPSAPLVVIDGKGHLFGRLASTVAKELLNGKRVVIVRSELVEMSGSLFRNKSMCRLFPSQAQVADI